MDGDCSACECWLKFRKTLYTNTVPQLLGFLIYINTKIQIVNPFQYVQKIEQFYSLVFKIWLRKGDKQGKKILIRKRFDVLIFRQSFSEHLSPADTRLAVSRHFVLMKQTCKLILWTQVIKLFCSCELETVCVCFGVFTQFVSESCHLVISSLLSYRLIRLHDKTTQGNVLVIISQCKKYKAALWLCHSFTEITDTKSVSRKMKCMQSGIFICLKMKILSFTQPHFI